MPKKGHTEEQIIAALRQYEARDKTADICRKLGVSWLRELGATHVRYGYRRLTVLLRREEWQVNAKREALFEIAHSKDSLLSIWSAFQARQLNSGEP